MKAQWNDPETGLSGEVELDEETASRVRKGRIDAYSTYEDEYWHHMGYCNSCGEEAVIGSECCEDGEVVPYGDDESEAL